MPVKEGVVDVFVWVAAGEDLVVVAAAAGGVVVVVVYK